MNYPPRGVQGVRFYDLHGVPITFGPVPGCPHRIAQWGYGAPIRFGEPDAISLREDAKEVSEDEFRQLVTIKLAGY